MRDFRNDSVPATHFRDEKKETREFAQSWDWKPEVVLRLGLSPQDRLLHGGLRASHQRREVTKTSSFSEAIAGDSQNCSDASESGTEVLSPGAR